MLKLEVDPIKKGKKFILETEEDIKAEDLINKIKILLKDEGTGILISCDKEGVLRPGESLSDLGIVSGERLLYIGRA